MRWRTRLGVAMLVIAHGHPVASSQCPMVDTAMFQGRPAGSLAPCNSPFGECESASGRCLCLQGAMGPNCTARCNSGCSGHGTCAIDGSGVGKCVCDVGYRSINASHPEGSNDCGIACPGVPANAECSGNGICSIDGACVCRPGFLGADCSQECPGGAGNPCSGHGTCSASGSCTCDPTTTSCNEDRTCEQGYVGLSCQLRCPYFHGMPCGCSDANAPGCRGKCQGDGTCKCTSRFAGADCSVECAADALGNACSGKGLCTASGTCDCFKGWVGPKCDVACPGGAAFECSNNGRCEVTSLNTSRCVCHSKLDGFVAAYLGDMCDIAVYNTDTRLAQERPMGEAAQLAPDTPAAAHLWPTMLILVATAACICPYSIVRLKRLVWLPGCHECLACKGTGNRRGSHHENHLHLLQCRVCRGTGVVDKELQICTACNGSGTTDHHECLACNGDGVVETSAPGEKCMLNVVPLPHPRAP